MFSSQIRELLIDKHSPELWRQTPGCSYGIYFLQDELHLTFLIDCKRPYQKSKKRPVLWADCPLWAPSTQIALSRSGHSCVHSLSEEKKKVTIWNEM